jgi:hypothetical protein
MKRTISLIFGAVRMDKDVALVPPERIERSILLIHSHKVMLDPDLAALYGVEIKQLIQAVKRNIFRFPSDFMFQLGVGILLTPSQNRAWPCSPVSFGANAPFG